ncbi:ATP-binding protein [Sulfitobacter guttiformis]|nr:ATP-binding protein [Sulfitobacter guttiformis]KIN72867.1 putative transposition protein [Sulfitobacter guttiformis KCTC 32187]
MNIESQALAAEPDQTPSSAVMLDDPRPGLNDTAELSDWLLKRYMVSNWDNQLVQRLEMVLKRDEDGNILSEPKRFQNETMGIAVTAPAREGKSFLVQQVLSKVLDEEIDVDKCGPSILYCRLRTDATVKGVYKDICAKTGFTTFPAQMTRAQANELATHRLKLKGIKIVILDEVHNLLKPSEPVNLFLKTFLQDGGGYCLITIGTTKLRSFIYDDPQNDELAGRLLDFQLEAFPRSDTVSMIGKAIQQLASDAGLKLNPTVSSDPYFSDRVYDGCKGSYGRCMRLIATSVVRAKEDGAVALDIEDFKATFELTFKHYNPVNPFEFPGWVDGTSAEADTSEVLFDNSQSDFRAKNKGRRVNKKVAR